MISCVKNLFFLTKKTIKDDIGYGLKDFLDFLVITKMNKQKFMIFMDDSGASRLKVISCIKARKYIKRGCQLYLAQVTEKEPTDKCLKDVPVIHDFPKVFPDDLPGLPPTRPVEFQIDLVPGFAPVPHAPYQLAPSEMKELVTNYKNYWKRDLFA
ncbi:hypothetical protein Tco_0481211 [Tanacetum coccineum]